MADLLQEVDDVMRQERMEKLWQENKFYIIGFVIGTIVLTGLLSAYRSWDFSVKEEQTAAIIAMMDDDAYPENVVEAELDFRDGLRGITIMQAAATALGQNKNDVALKLYERAVTDSGIPTVIRQSAIIASANLNLDLKENVDAQVLLKNLQTVTQDQTSPWQAHAHILAAVIQARKSEDYTAALMHLNAASKIEGLPATLQERIDALTHLYTIKSQSTSETG